MPNWHPGLHKLLSSQNYCHDYGQSNIHVFKWSRETTGSSMDSLPWQSWRHRPHPSIQKVIRTKEPTKDILVLLWNSGRALLYRASFSKWDNDGTNTDKPYNVNVRFIINDLAEDIYTFERLLQEIFQNYSTKAQIWKVKLQSCPDPETFGFIM